MTKGKITIFLGVLLLAAISLMGWLLFKCQSEPKTTNQSGVSIVNNCDTIYQYITIPNPQMTFSNTTNNLSKHGMGISLGYDYSLIQKSGGLSYGLNYRYQNFILGGYYNGSLQTYGLKLGFQFDSLEHYLKE